MRLPLSERSRSALIGATGPSSASDASKPSCIFPSALMFSGASSIPGLHAHTIYQHSYMRGAEQMAFPFIFPVLRPSEGENNGMRLLSAFFNPMYHSSCRPLDINVCSIHRTAHCRFGYPPRRKVPFEYEGDAYRTRLSTYNGVESALNCLPCVLIRRCSPGLWNTHGCLDVCY